MAKKASKKKSAKKRTSKKRADKYDSKLAIIGTLDEVLKVSIPKK
jgi:dsDNA-binding SOS-regulon protein